MHLKFFVDKPMHNQWLHVHFLLFLFVYNSMPIAFRKHLKHKIVCTLNIPCLNGIVEWPLYYEAILRLLLLCCLNEFTEYRYTLVGSENNRRKCTRQISSFPLVCILQDLISGQLRILIAQGANVCRIYIACKLDV